MRRLVIRAIGRSAAMLGALLLCAAAAGAGAQEELRLAPQLGQGDVKGVAISLDGHEVVTAAGNLVWLWDAENGRQLRAFVGHTADVTSVAFSADGRRVLTGSEDHTARLWDAATGKQLRTFETKYDVQIRAVAISPDGRFVAAGGESGATYLWDAGSGKLLHERGPGGLDVLAIAFSPDGRYVLTGGLNNTATLWDRATGAEVRTFGTIYHPNTTPKPGEYPPHGIAMDPNPKWISSVAFSPDGKFIVAANEDGSAQMLATATGKEMQTFGSGRPMGLLSMSDSVYSVAFSPDGKTVLMGGKTWAWLFDVNSGEQVRSYGGMGSSPNYVAFVADGSRVLTGGGHLAALLDAKTGEVVRDFVGHTQAIRSAVFSADGQRLATGGNDGTAHVWETAAGHETLALSDGWFQVGQVAFTPDGSALLASSTEEKAMLWDAVSGATIHKFADEKAISTNHISISRDGRFVLTSHLGEKAGAALWDALTGKQLRAYEPPAELNFSYLAESADIFHAAAFSSDGRVLVSSVGGTSSASVWNTASGRETTQLENKVLSESVFAVDLSKDGKIALTGDMGGHARLWHASIGVQEQVFSANSEPVEAVALSPDQKTVLTGSWDHTARLWDRANGKQVREFNGTRDGWSPWRFRRMENLR